MMYTFISYVHKAAEIIEDVSTSIWCNPTDELSEQLRKYCKSAQMGRNQMCGFMTDTLRFLQLLL